MRGYLLLVVAALTLVTATFGQPHQSLLQSSPAPDFLAYQSLFSNIVFLENLATQADAKQGAGNASSNGYRSQVPEAAGLSVADYEALVAIAVDYAQQKAAYVSARDAVLTAVYAQQAAGGKATWSQAVQLNNLYRQYISMIENHVAQPATKLSPAGAQALANYVHGTIAPSVTWGALGRQPRRPDPATAVVHAAATDHYFHLAEHMVQRRDHFGDDFGLELRLRSHGAAQRRH